MKKVICMILMIGFMCNISACGTERSEKVETSVLASRAIQKMVQSENYIYNSVHAPVFRYNLTTEEFGYACMNPTCDHTYFQCSLYYTRGISFCVNNRLYYAREGKERTVSNPNAEGSDKTIYAYYDLTTGEEFVLTICSQYETYRSSLMTDGTYMYYSHLALKDGGDASDPKDYAPAMMRMPLNGGEEEILFYTDSDSYPVAVAHNRILFEQGRILYSTDFAGENILILFDDETHYSFIEGGYWNEEYYYFLSVYRTEKLLNEVTYPYMHLFRVHMESGICEQLLDQDVRDFLVTEDKIYYFETKVEYQYIPDDPYDYSSYILTGNGGTMRSCNLDGSDPVVEYVNETLRYEDMLYYYTVVDGDLYGEFSIYDPKSQTRSNLYFGKVDLQTGELTVLADVQNYIKYYRITN